jgi:hypothetical protein
MTPSIKKIYGGLRSVCKSGMNNVPFPSIPVCHCIAPQLTRPDRHTAFE